MIKLFCGLITIKKAAVDKHFMIIRIK